jgi:hypothetical protein
MSTQQIFSMDQWLGVLWDQGGSDRLVSGDSKLPLSDDAVDTVL